MTTTRAASAALAALLAGAAAIPAVQGQTYYGYAPSNNTDSPDYYGMGEENAEYYAYNMTIDDADFYNATDSAQEFSRQDQSYYNYTDYYEYSNNNVLEILSAIYDQTGGYYGWKNRDGWDSDNYYSYCNWSGIQCYDVDEDNERYGMIETLDLSSNRLSGELPQSVYSIPYLRNLILRENPDLVVFFDNLEDARFLQTLIVSDTTIDSFDGFQYAGRFLEEFHMTGCGLNGPFPWEVLQVRSLVSLYANYNYFYGRIPEDIGNLERLEELYLYENDLEGPLPDAIGYVRELRVLVASNNDLSGPLPAGDLNNMKNLNVLALANNNFKGRVPPFDNLSGLRQLFLQYNQFDGEIPEDFLWSAPKDELIKVDLSHNYLSGTVAGIRLPEFERLNINLVGNHFEGIDTELCRNGAWLGGNVDSYGCNGILCPIGFSAPEGRQTDSDECTKCNTADYMGTTNCNGLQKAILSDFYDALHGDYWRQNNWFGEEYYDRYYGGDECAFDGIECNNDGEVVSIELSGYKLSGTPPGNLFSLPKLELLDLSNNFIQFEFDGIFMAKNLRVLDLSSTGLRSLENIDELSGTSITELYLNSNSIDSTIPDDIYDLESLENLMVSLGRN